MSVPKSQRSPSSYEAVHVPEVMYDKVIKVCAKMPKRYTYLLLKDTVEIAGRIVDHVAAANSIFPTNQHEAQMRRDYWIRARALNQALSRRINRFINAEGSLTYVDENGKKKGVTKNELKEIMDMIIREQALITGTIKSEANKYKNLPGEDVDSMLKGSLLKALYGMLNDGYGL